MEYNLNRFKQAQESACGGYEAALREVKNGQKVSHWMWYIFPQLRGLGKSSTADLYGISGLDEAAAYLADPMLGARLVEITEVLIGLEEKNAVKIFGYTDMQKLRSCMTLFAAASGQNSVFQQVIDLYYEGKMDRTTLDMLR